MKKSYPNEKKVHMQLYFQMLNKENFINTFKYEIPNTIKTIVKD
jgi:hypothetical protein